MSHFQKRDVETSPFLMRSNERRKIKQNDLFSLKVRDNLSVTASVYNKSDSYDDLYLSIYDIGMTMTRQHIYISFLKKICLI